MATVVMQTAIGVSPIGIVVMPVAIGEACAGIVVMPELAVVVPISAGVTWIRGGASPIPAGVGRRSTAVS